MSRSSVLWPLLVSALACQTCKTADVVQAPPAAEETPTPLQVDLFVMSQCPYGVQAEEALFPALDRLDAHTRFRLHFIGGVGEDGSLDSMHGEDELTGDLLQICTAEKAPAKLRPLVLCMNQDASAIPGNFLECARSLGIDPAPVTACAEGDEGRRLLGQSFRLAEGMGIGGSPTLLLAGTPYEGPRTPEAYLRALCRSFSGTPPRTCQELPAPRPIPLTVVSDTRCSACGPAVEEGTRQLRTMFEGLQVRVVDYGTDEGKALYRLLRDAEQPYLPAFLFGQEVTQDAFYAQVTRFFRPVGTYQMLAVEATFDPTSEICDNQVDDDGNGLVDCGDPGCAQTLACRPDRPNRLEVFVMSHCPFGILAIQSMKEVVEAFGDPLEFQVHFLADETAPGTFESLHGPAEVEEDLRQVCVQRLAKKPRDFLAYLWCRNGDLSAPDWQTCLPDRTLARKVQQCFQGPQGRQWLSEDLKIGEALGIGASPTWLVNNRHLANGLSPAEIQQMICQHNPALAGCKTPLSEGSGDLPSGGGCGAP